jgi:hypothetical protein
MLMPAVRAIQDVVSIQREINVKLHISLAGMAENFLALDRIIVQSRHVVLLALRISKSSAHHPWRRGKERRLACLLPHLLDHLRMSREQVLGLLGDEQTRRRERFLARARLAVRRVPGAEHA